MGGSSKEKKKSLEEEAEVPADAILQLAPVVGKECESTRKEELSKGYVQHAASLQLLRPPRQQQQQNEKANDAVVASIVLDLSTSLRKKKQPRCLVVGRQAASADVRVDHGSISRKHAVLYYQPVDDSSAFYRLYVKDLGGKHGTKVNQRRLDKSQAIPLHHGDVLTFGNYAAAPFRVNLQQHHSTQSESSEAEPEEVKTKEPLTLTGRAKREAEIAAMAASLEEAPSYQPYAQPQPHSTASDNTNTDTNTDSDTNTKLNIPTSHHVTCHGHTKLISTLALDPAGSRMLSGSTDGTVRLWDFGGMDGSHQSFKQLKIDDGDDGVSRHPVIALSWSPSGDSWICGTTSAQPKIYDRDGRELLSFIKGDVYVTDQAHTKGHTSSITAAVFHPLQPHLVFTSSTDGSVRQWDLQHGKKIFDKLVCFAVYKVKNQRGQRTSVTSMAMHASGREFVVGTACGSVQIWNIGTSKTTVVSRPVSAVYQAHGTDTAAVTSVVYAPLGGEWIVSRSQGNDTCKMWDGRRRGRKMELACMREWQGVPCRYEWSNAAFGSKGECLAVGSSSSPSAAEETTKDGGGGMLQFFDVSEESLLLDNDENDNESHGAQERKPMAQIRVTDEGSKAEVVCVLWHAKLNQIFCGLSDGSIRIFYDPRISTKGAMLSTSRGVKTPNALELLLASRYQPSAAASAAIRGPIITPNSLPMYRNEEQRGKRKRELAQRMDPVETRRPEPPAKGVLTGGRTSASVNFTQFVVQSRIKNKNIAGKDPREELFKYAEGKSYVDHAYDEGAKELAEKTAEEEQEEAMSKKTQGKKS